MSGNLPKALRRPLPESSGPSCETGAVVVPIFIYLFVCFIIYFILFYFILFYFIYFVVVVIVPILMVGTLRLRGLRA